MKFGDLNTALLMDRKHAEFHFEVREKLLRRVAANEGVVNTVKAYVDLTDILVYENRLLVPIQCTPDERISMDIALRNILRAVAIDNAGGKRPSRWCRSGVNSSCKKFVKFHLI